MQNSIITYKKAGSILILFFSFFLFMSCSEDPIDLDPDNDGITGTLDNCRTIANKDQADNDGDRIGDACDDDDDNDGILDVDDPFPFNANNSNITPCINGMAGIYPCNDYDLIAHIPLSELNGEGADSWGWTDSTTGKEYAILCTTTGTTFVDISDTENLILLGTLPTQTINSPWRDVKVYQDHAFIVADNNVNEDSHGMQVFDLTRLRNVTNIPETFTADTHYNGFGRAHNLVINEDSGYAYAVGTNRQGTYKGGPLFININNPLNPILEGGFLGYAHDAQVVTYNGPDNDHTGKEILIGSNENEVVIIDVTNKSNPVKLATVAYPNIGYTHQGWFTEDLKYFIVGDEFDEKDFGGNTRTLIFDLNDLDNPTLHTTYTGPTAAIDHNGYVKGNTFYLANYTAGVRFIDISDIGNKNMIETGFFDTYPANNGTTFNGAWNVYPYFASGNILISDIDGGLFIVRKSGT